MNEALGAWKLLLSSGFRGFFSGLGSLLIQKEGATVVSDLNQHTMFSGPILFPGTCHVASPD